MSRLLLEVNEVSELFSDSKDVMPQGGKYSFPSGYFQVLGNGNLMLTEDKRDTDGIWLARCARPTAKVLELYKEMKNKFGLSDNWSIRCFTVTKFADRYAITMLLGDGNFHATLAVVPDLNTLKHSNRKI